MRKRGGVRELLEFKWFKVSAAIFLGGFFIGYNLAFLDLAFPLPVLVPYLAKESAPTYYPFASPMEKLDYAKYTLAEGVVVLGGGVLIGLVTAGALFALGLSVGASLPAILEYSVTQALARSVGFAALFGCALTFLGASGLSLGDSILRLIRDTSWRIDRRAYDALLLGLALLALAVILEVL